MQQKRTLILMRHAKTEVQQPGQKDYDRALTEGGQNDAAQMGKRLRALGIYPEMIFHSSAVRTQQTADIVATTMDTKPAQIQALEQLYLCEAHTLEHLVLDMPKHIHTAMIIAHNPGISTFVYESNRMALSSAMPTAGIVVFSIDTADWQGYNKAKKHIELIDFPKNNL